MISIFALYIIPTLFCPFVLSSISNPFLSMNLANIMAESSFPLSSINSSNENHDSNIHLRVASFAAYLKPNEEDFVLKLTESFRKPSLATGLPDESGFVGKSKKLVEGEIGVFDAEKYFKMKIGDESPMISHSETSKFWNEKSEDLVDLKLPRSKNKPGTPSASSESSWNSSQNPLFSSIIQTPSHKDKRGMGNRFFTGFACRGSCSDGKSVNINKNGSPHAKDFTKKTLQVDQSSMVGYKKEEKFAFLRVNSGVKTIPVKTQIDEEKPGEGRDSIEVFGSHVLNKGDIAQNLERKLSVLTWDAIPQTQNLKSTNSRTSDSCDQDDDSDGSSDLFEIENISADVPTKPQYTRQQSDGGMSSCMTPRTLYAPSEASIEWSVVTASAVDFSALSEYGELKMGSPNWNSINKAMQGRPATGLLGCKSDKAVRVVQPAYQSNQKVKSGQELNMLKAEKKVKEFEFFPPTQRAMF